jgi:hypothetical protein
MTVTFSDTVYRSGPICHIQSTITRLYLATTVLVLHILLRFRISTDAQLHVRRV